MNKDEAWDEALRLIHKFCPQSRSQILVAQDLQMDKVYGVFKCINPNFLEKRVPLPDCHKSENMLQNILGTSLDQEAGRVIAIHDLGDFSNKPIICSAKSLVERVSEGVEINVNGKTKLGEFIAGGDTLFLFESTGRMLMFDHDDHYCLVEQN